MFRPTLLRRSHLLLAACLLGCPAVFASPPLPALAHFDVASRQAVAQRLHLPLDADTAARLALLQHPAAQADWLNLGTSPDALLAAAWLSEGPFDLWQLLLAPAARLDGTQLKAVASLHARSLAAQQAWYAAAAAQASQRLLADQLGALTAIETLAQAQREAGNLPRIDEARTLADAAEGRQALLASQAHLQLASLGLRSAMGLDAGCVLNLADLPLPPMQLPDPAALLAKARQQNPALREALAALRQPANQRLPAPRTILLPLLGNGNPLAAGEHPFEAPLTAARAELDAKQAIGAGLIRLAQAQAGWRLSEQIVPQRAAVLAEAVKHYNGMLRGLDVLLAARQAEAASRQAALVAQAEVWQAWLALEAAVGGRIARPAAAAAAPAAPTQAEPAPHGHTHALP